jgi:hypothetical protein
MPARQPPARGHHHRHCDGGRDQRQSAPEVGRRHRGRGLQTHEALLRLLERGIDCPDADLGAGDDRTGAAAGQRRLPVGPILIRAQHDPRMTEVLLFQLREAAAGIRTGGRVIEADP